MRVKKRFRPALAALLLCTSACSSAEPFSLPNIALPEAFRFAPKPSEDIKNQTALVPQDALWKAMNDSTLQALIQHALANNHSIEQAKARIAQARAQAAISKAALLPDISATSSLGQGNRNNPIGDDALDSIEAGIGASWEVDVFGKKRAERDARISEAVRSEAGLHDMQRIVVADVALAYNDMRYAQARIKVQQQWIAQSKEQRTLTQSLEDAGVVSHTDTLIASRELSKRRAEINGLRTLRDQSLSRITLLAPDLPETQLQALRTPQPMLQAPPLPIFQTPATIIRTRPDVRAAEAALLTSHSELRAAVAQQYPSLSLSAFFGWRDNGLAPSGDIWSLGNSLAAPIINFGRIQRGIDASDAGMKQAIEAYKGQMRMALDDIERNLIAWRDSGKEMHQREQTQSLAAQAQDLATERYSRGITSYLEVIPALQAHYDAQSSLLAAQHSNNAAAIGLYRAIGDEAYMN